MFSPHSYHTHTHSGRSKVVGRVPTVTHVLLCAPVTQNKNRTMASFSNFVKLFLLPLLTINFCTITYFIRLSEYRNLNRVMDIIVVFARPANAAGDWCDNVCLC